MHDPVPPDSEQNLEAPAKLAAALKASARRKVFVPPTIDEAILKAARAQLHPQSRPNAFHWPRWVLWPALVGACVAVALIAHMLPSRQFVREDLNRDGKVDILDSFSLARELKHGGSLPAFLDVNGDGVVDERDVNAIASQAVALEKDNRP
jgi:hypothetical protein